MRLKLTHAFLYDLGPNFPYCRETAVTVVTQIWAGCPRNCGSMAAPPSDTPRVELDMSQQTIRATDSHTLPVAAPRPTTPKPKPTGPQVVEIGFGGATYMASRHPEHGSALAVHLQGRTIPIPVCQVIFDREPYTRILRIVSVQWESPYSGYSPEWQSALIDLVDTHGSDIAAKAGA